MSTHPPAPTCAACNRAGHRIQRCPEIAERMKGDTMTTDNYAHISPDPAQSGDFDRCYAELTRAELAIERRDIWLTEAGETERDLRAALAIAHDAIGAARALLHELDAGGNYPHSSVAIGVVLMALEKATR
jgi:hypothetical protein